jgi:hypothetical protein
MGWPAVGWRTDCCPHHLGLAMQHLKLPVVLVLTLVPAALASRAAHGQDMPGPEITSVGDTPPPTEATQDNPIPPNVEGQAMPAQGGGYCYGGPHPAPGGGWEAITSPHVHDYAPFDLRLFSLHEGCYYFIGDPRDFGYTGQTYSYYGAHPVADSYGGGWCFMIGAHAHWWQPWSPYFTVVGPWYYWNGPYDPFFWSYWPYYSFYYRSYYPHYYAGGRYFHTWRTAPPITRVPPTGWRGGQRGQPGGGSAWRGQAGGGASGAWRGSPPAAATAPLRSQPHGAPGGWRGAPATGSGGWHAPSTGGGWHGSPVPSTPAPLHSAPGGGWHAPSGGGWHPSTPGGGWHGAPSGGGWRGAPSGGSFHPAPSGGGWHAPSGGGFHGGGGFRGGGGGFRGGGHR